VLLEGRVLRHLTGRYRGCSTQAVTYRFRRALTAFVNRPRRPEWPGGDVVLLADGVWFQFQGQPWVVYLMALKSCAENRAVFLDPVLRPGRESIEHWKEAFATIPRDVHPRVRALISDNIRGVPSLARERGWVLQLCHFHLISQLHGRRGRHKRTVADRQHREVLYQLIREALARPDGPELTAVLTQLHQLLAQPLVTGRMRMVAREFLRRLDLYRAYRLHPALDLPTTTGAVEAMGRIIRTLLHRIRNLGTPGALHLWITALIRLRPHVRCNGMGDQPNFFV
jgi:hypothetical protein